MLLLRDVLWKALDYPKLYYPASIQKVQEKQHGSQSLFKMYKYLK